MNLAKRLSFQVLAHIHFDTMIKETGISSQELTNFVMKGSKLDKNQIEKLVAYFKSKGTDSWTKL